MKSFLVIAALLVLQIRMHGEPPKDTNSSPRRNTNQFTFGTNGVPLRLLKDATNSLVPGLYIAEPYKMMVMVPPAHSDARMLRRGSADIDPKMIVPGPSLRFVPKGGLQKK
jgi:hypothetical protein